MAKRITVVLDDDVVKKLRNIQARQITKTTKSVSFSKVLNQVLKESLSKGKSHT